MPWHNQKKWWTTFDQSDGKPITLPFTLIPEIQEFILQHSLRPPIGLRDCVNGPFMLSDSAWLRENEKNNCVIAWNWHVYVMRERSFWCAWWREKPFLICVICVIAWNRKKYVRDCVKGEKCDQFVWFRESVEISAWWRENGEKFAWLRDWTSPLGLIHWWTFANTGKLIESLLSNLRAFIQQPAPFSNSKCQHRT